MSTVTCAYCDKIIKKIFNGKKEITHTICKPCAKRIDKETEKYIKDKKQLCKWVSHV